MTNKRVQQSSTKLKLAILHNRIYTELSVEEIIELMCVKAQYFGSIRKPNIDYAIAFGDRMSELVEQIRYVDKRK